MESIRFPRFQRVRAVVPIRLTERDREIIGLIHEHRFLRSSHLVALLNGSPQSLLRRLQLLYHHGYLERPRAQIEYYHRGGSRHIIYGIGNKGAALLKQNHGPGVRWGEKNRSVGRIYLEHAVLVSDVMVALELACRKTGAIRLLQGEQLPVMGDILLYKPFKWNVSINGGAKLGVIPDRVFALEWGNEDTPQNRCLFFLEADRGTMPVIRKNLSQTSMYRKFLAYEATWSQELHRSKFGFNRFRVLTVTTGAARVKSLVAACSQLQRGRGLFLFTDKGTLEKSEDMFTLQWQTGRQGETAPMLELPRQS